MEKGIRAGTTAVALALALLCNAAFAAEPIRIGAIFSVTGPAAMLGEPERNTAKMVVDRINEGGGLLGRPVELVVADDESEPTKAVTAVDRLIKKERVVAVIGPSTSGSTLAIVPKMKEAKLPLVSCAAAKKIVQPVDPWIFKTAQSDFLAVTRIYRHMKKAGISKVAILTASDAYGAAGREELKGLAPQFGIAVAGDEVYGPKDTDMTAQLAKIKGMGVQAVVCWGTNPGPAVVARNRTALGMKVPLYMSHGVESRKFIELAGAANAEGILLPAGRLSVADQLPAKSPQKNFLVATRKAYEEKYRQPLSAFGGYAWDALSLLAQAVRNAKSAEPAAIRDALEKIRGFQGVTGEFHFSPSDHNGLTEDAFVMVKVSGGNWEMIR